MVGVSKCGTVSLQGGPTKVKQTYIFAGNIILVNSMVFGKFDNSLDFIGKRKNSIFYIVHQMAKIIEFYLRIEMLPAKLASLAGPLVKLDLCNE